MYQYTHIFVGHLIEIILLIFTILIFVLYLYKNIIKRKGVQCAKTIPGLNKSDPSLGNLGELKDHGSLHQFLQSLHKQFGNVASFYWLDTYVVSICDHNSFKNVKHLFDRANLIFDNFKQFIGEECIQYAKGAEGQDRRKCYDRSFTPEAIIRYINDFVGAADGEISKIEESQTKIVESIHDMSLRMAVQTILKCCISPGERNAIFYQKVLDLYQVVFGGCTARLIENKTFESTDPEEIEFQAAQIEFHDLIMDMVTKRMKYLDDEAAEREEPLLIDDIIRFHGDVKLGVIVKEVLVFMIAGFHTSGNLLCWCLYYLAKHPDYQDRLFNEIQQHSFVFDNTRRCLDLINSLPFLRACINEALRVGELATFGSRESTEDIIIDQYVIPAHTPIILAFGVSYTDPEVFPSPQEYNPDRFMHDSFPSLSFVPFGFAGKRKCPGERFTYLETSIWLIRFVKKYRFSLQHPDEEVKKYYGLVTHLGTPAPMAFTTR